MKKIAIERTLTDVRSLLEDNNFRVDILDSTNKASSGSLNQYDAIVVTGADENLMGIQNVVTNTQIINAEGKTAEEIYQEINNRINK
ncbi:MAG: YkuS family protein [Bacillota bacterium]